MLIGDPEMKNAYPLKIKELRVLSWRRAGFEFPLRRSTSGFQRNAGRKLAFQLE